jgi:hypothetical protein
MRTAPETVLWTSQQNSGIPSVRKERILHTHLTSLTDLRKQPFIMGEVTSRSRVGDHLGNTYQIEAPISQGQESRPPRATKIKAQAQGTEGTRGPSAVGYRQEALPGGFQTVAVSHSSSSPNRKIPSVEPGHVRASPTLADMDTIEGVGGVVMAVGCCWWRQW